MSNLLSPGRLSDPADIKYSPPMVNAFDRCRIFRQLHVPAIAALRGE